MGTTLAELARRVQGGVRGDAEHVIERANSLDQAGPRDIAFFVGGRHHEQLATTRAGAVVLSDDDAARFSGNAIVVKNPQLAFARISEVLHPVPMPPSGIHPSAVVDKTAQIAPTAAIGPTAIVSAHAVIGDGVLVGPGCVVGRNVQIGENTRLVARVTVLSDCVIGRRCLLHPGAVIGADGFGFARDGSRWVRQPQIGRVTLGDDVEIGANTTVDRATFGETAIGNGVKIDNLVHIAHNVRIGDDTAIAGCVGIAGSTVVGKRCTIAGQAGIIDHVEIADDVHIAAATVVAGSITEPGAYSSSLKHQPAMQWRRNLVRLTQLDELARRLQKLEQQMKRLIEEQP